MKLGVQLYAVPKEVLESDIDRVLEQVAELGYQGIELPWMVDCHTKLNELGLECSALHIGPESLTNLDELIRFTSRHSCSRLCLSGPLGWHDRSLENFAKTAQLMNEALPFLHQAGLELHYHNHEFEFEAADGNKTPISLLSNELEPEIGFCVDTGWVEQAGTSAVEFMGRHSNRIKYVHLRDFKNNEATALGKGDVAVDSIWYYLKQNPNIEWAIIEHEPCDNYLEVYSDSLLFLKELGV